MMAGGWRCVLDMTRSGPDSENMPHFGENVIIPGTQSSPDSEIIPITKIIPYFRDIWWIHTLILGKLVFQNRPCRAAFGGSDIFGIHELSFKFKGLKFDTVESLSVILGTRTRDVVCWIPIFLLQIFKFWLIRQHSSGITQWLAPVLIPDKDKK